jgi:hypothetical protein
MIVLGIVQGLIGFVIYFGAISLALRIARRIEPALLVVAATFVIFFVALALLIAIGQRINFWVFGASYWFFALSFLVAFGSIYKSVSLRILSDLSREPGRSCLYDDVLARYIAQESYKNRLMVIEDKRLATRSGTLYTLTNRGRKVAATARAIQEVFGITHSG